MKAKTILVVDDEFFTSEILAFVLEDVGYRVLSAFNGSDALDKLELTPADLIILDVMMPIMNGAEFASVVRADPRLGSIPILITSALSESRVRSMFGHIDGFLRKPFVMDTALSLVRAMLAAGEAAAPGMDVGAMHARSSAGVASREKADGTGVEAGGPAAGDVSRYAGNAGRVTGDDRLQADRGDGGEDSSKTL